MVQEAFGVNDHIQDVTRRFADAGYAAVAPAIFHRAGPDGEMETTRRDHAAPAVPGASDSAIRAWLDHDIAG